MLEPENLEKYLNGSVIGKVKLGLGPPPGAYQTGSLRENTSDLQYRVDRLISPSPLILYERVHQNPS